MFVRDKRIGPYEYLYLVENAREGGRHVQRVIKPNFHTYGENKKADQYVAGLRPV